MTKRNIEIKVRLSRKEAENLNTEDRPGETAITAPIIRSPGVN